MGPNDLFQINSSGRQKVKWGILLKIWIYKKNKKNKRTEFLRNTIVILDSELIDELNKLGLKEIPSGRKGDTVMDRIDESPENHKHIKDKKH